MSPYRSRGSVEAARSLVWSHLSAVTHWPEWLPTVTALKPLDTEALAVGARFDITQPRLVPATWTVTELVAGERFTWEARTPGLRTVARHVLFEESPGHTRVTLEVEFSGPMRVVASLAAGRLTQRYLDTEIASLAKRCASAPGAAPAR